MAIYSIAGLIVLVDFEVPDMTSCPDPGINAEIDIKVEAGKIPTDLPGATDNGPTWQIAPSAIQIDVPGVVRLLAADGKRLTYVPADACGAADVAAFVLGTGLGILLQQRGDTVLRAGALRVGDGLVLICGGSGAGTSTLLAALTTRGYRLAGDDFCVLRTDRDGRLIAAPDARAPAVWQQAIDVLECAGVAKATRRTPVRPGLAKFRLHLPRDTEGKRPLRALYLLCEDRTANEPRIERLNLANSAAALPRYAFRPGLVLRMGQEELYLKACAGVRRQGGVRTLHRRLRFDALKPTLDALEADWQRIT